MKKFLLSFVIVCLAGMLTVWAQLPKLNYTERIPYHSRLTPNAAVTNAWSWFDSYTKATPTAKESQLRSEKGIFKGVSSFQYVSKVASGNDYSKGTIYYTIYLKINESDGTYTYEITDFVHQARASLGTITQDAKYPYYVNGDKMWHNMVWKDIREQIAIHTRELSESLKTAMNSPSSSSVKKQTKGPVVIIVKN